MSSLGGKLTGEDLNKGEDVMNGRKRNRPQRRSRILEILLRFEIGR